MKGMGISLDESRDSDIIRWHDANKGKISALVRAAIRETYLTSDSTPANSEILAGIQRIEEMFRKASISSIVGRIEEEDDVVLLLDNDKNKLHQMCSDIGWE